MLNNKNLFWKNFRLGTELQISGSFIYNGLLCLENMETFYYEEECFELLYNISVGFERLLKVAIILTEHKNTSSQEAFEKELITHNHFELLNRLKKHHKIQLGEVHNKFISLLDKFYKSARYERYNVDSVHKPSQDKRELVAFIKDGLNMELDSSFGSPSPNTCKIKKFIGKIVGKFTSQLYEIVRTECYRLEIFTYEITYGSKAFKIFIERKYDFYYERISQKEILIHLIKNGPSDKFKSIIEKIGPLPFQNLHTNKYIESILDIQKIGQLLGETEYLYQELKPDMSRLKLLESIGSEYNIEEEQ